MDRIEKQGEEVKVNVEKKKRERQKLWKFKESEEKVARRVAVKPCKTPDLHFVWALLGWYQIYHLILWQLEWQGGVSQKGGEGIDSWDV